MTRRKQLIAVGIIAATLPVVAVVAFEGKKEKGPFADADVAALAEAARTGDCGEIDKLVARKVDVNARGKEGMTPLLYSVTRTLYSQSWGNAKGFERLLVHGADPNLQDDKGAAAINVAAQNPEDPAFLKMALAHGGDPNLRRRSKHIPPPNATPGVPITYLNFTPTPIFNAIRSHNPENVRILIKAGADLDIRDDGGNTPLMAAATTHAYDAMLLMLEAGADFRFKEKDGLPLSHFFTDDYDSVDPKSPAAAVRQRCREFMEKKGVDFKKEKIENERINERLNEKGLREELKTIERLKQEGKLDAGAAKEGQERVKRELEKIKEGKAEK